MEKKQELKVEHIKPYIGTGLKAMYGNPPHIKYVEVEVVGIVHRSWETHPTRILADNMDSEHIWMFKPILRPLSRLTDEEFDFVYEYEIDYDSIEHWVELDCESRLTCKFSLGFWERLFENHFDVFGLIEKGLAIEKQIEK